MRFIVNSTIKIPFSFALIPTFVLLLCILFFEIETYCGISLTYDSFEYLASAKSFLYEKKFLRSDGSINTIWAPLFSFILALFNLKLSFIKYLNYFIIAFTSLVCSKISQKLNLTSNIWLFLTLSIICWHSDYHMCLSFLWSEPLFILLYLTHLLLLIYFLENHSFKNLLLASLLAFFMCLQRNAGIFLVIANTCYLIAYQKQKQIPALYFSISSVGWFIWNLRNFLIAKTRFHPSIEEYANGIIFKKENIYEYVINGSTWIFPLKFPILSIIIFVVFWILITFSTFKLLRSNRLTILLYLNIFIYWICMQFVEDKTYDEVLRYNAVIMPVFYLLFFSIAKNLTNLYGNIKFKTIILIICCIILIYNIIRTCKNIYIWYLNSCDNKNEILDIFS